MTSYNLQLDKFNRFRIGKTQHFCKFHSKWGIFKSCVILFCRYILVLKTLGLVCYIIYLTLPWPDLDKDLNLQNLDKLNMTTSIPLHKGFEAKVVLGKRYSSLPHALIIGAKKSGTSERIMFHFIHFSLM